MNSLVIVLLILAAVLYFWFDSMNTREIAIRIAKQACLKNEVQLLDQTVALKHLKLARSPQGRLIFQRIYVFEYTADGNERYTGRTIMLGMKVQRTLLEDHQGVVIDHE